MAEDITITFKGVDDVSSIIKEIGDKLNELDTGEEKDKDASGLEITIMSDQIEPEVEQVMWDVIDKIKTRATEEEAEFLLDI